MMYVLPWSEIKRISSEKKIAIQWVVPFTGEFYVYITEGAITFWCTLLDGTADYSEFVSSYKTSTATRVATSNSALANPEDYRFRGTTTGWGTAPVNTTTNLDLLLSATEERFVTGGVLLVEDASRGDTVTFSVVHPIAGVVETYVPSWSVLPGTSQQQIEVYPARIPAGLKLRVSYTNVGSPTAYFACNYYIHRKGIGA